MAGMLFNLVGVSAGTRTTSLVDQRQLGTATATANFFRALGGAVGAAVLGAVFAARAGVHASHGDVRGVDAALLSDIVDAVQTVFVVAAPLAALALIAVLYLPEAPLRTRPAPAHGGGQPDAGRAETNQEGEPPCRASMTSATSG